MAGRWLVAEEVAEAEADEEVNADADAEAEAEKRRWVKVKLKHVGVTRAGAGWELEARSTSNERNVPDTAGSKHTVEKTRLAGIRIFTAAVAGEEAIPRSELCSS